MCSNYTLLEGYFVTSEDDISFSWVELLSMRGLWEGQMAVRRVVDKDVVGECDIDGFCYS